MTLKNKLILLTSAAICAPAIAFAAVNVGETVGVSDEEILSKLEAAGYTEIEIEREDGEIEVEAMLNGQSFEIEIAADTGQIEEIELEDDDDDEDDKD